MSGRMFSDVLKDKSIFEVWLDDFRVMILLSNILLRIRCL